MFGKLSSEIEQEINNKGYHILRKSFARKKMYPNKFPDYDEIEQILIGKIYTLRLFVKHKRNGTERIDGGMIDVKIIKNNNEEYSGELLTLLPPNFPIKKGDHLKICKDEILFEQK
ncbi:MAG TPA: hypothetical protein P5123_07340 [Spirochaetota bacterium]|nr:hypothetical protein [Spirochaetota bacterium]